jgi:putative FmdB family regulatory protein
MPTYDYDCPDCGGFDAFRVLSQRNEPTACPDCGDLAPVFPAPPYSQ